MKKILGLDLGTNSIGWAVIEHDDEKHDGRILGTGSRIIPMTQDIVNDFGKGNSISKTAERTGYRSVRRLRERHLLRRERLIKVFKKLGWLENVFDPKKEKITYKFDQNVGKHLFQFEESYKGLVKVFEEFHQDEVKIPKDWTIYYLRKMALTEKVSPLELAWIILQFNQKRGYYELRSDSEGQQDSNKEFVKAIITEINDTGEKRGKNKILEVTLANGMVGTIARPVVPDWKGIEKELIVTSRELKDGSSSLAFSFPENDDWTLRKKRTESLIESNKKTVGEYILEILLKNPKAKIRGREVHTIERKYYRDELIKILKTQLDFFPELQNSQIYRDCVELLYPNNEPHRNMLYLQDFVWLFVNDILFYQRPLKSKKHLIEGCKFERRYHVKEGELIETKVKAIAKSHPLFQEFRIWSLLHNLRVTKNHEVNENGRIQLDVDKSAIYLTPENKEKLFRIFNECAEVSQLKIIKTLGLNEKDFRLNYEEDKKLPGNETLAKFLSGFKKSDVLSSGIEFLSKPENAERLWHILYSLEKKEFVRNALQNPDLKFPQEAVEIFVSMPAFKKDYGSYSAKAIRRLLTLMKCGSYLNQQVVEEIIPKFFEWKYSTEFDRLPPKIKGQLEKLEAIDEFKGLSLTLAEYVAYQFHSEEKETLIYKSPDDIKRLKQHSLRNPIVEQVINETLMVVKDIWKEYGKPDEIHLEMGRDLKNPAKKRQEMTTRRNENERINLRAKAMLMELKKEVSGINPYSVGQLELFKIYEEGALGLAGLLDEDIFKISSKEDPTPVEITRYKLWLDQKYRSPYTGKPIRLAGIFTRDYEIEHIFPQSRYFDDSFNNKVISETEVNRIKGNQTAFEFISNQGGQKIALSSGEVVTVLYKEDYIDLVKKTFRDNRIKQKNLLSYDIPESFIQRQLNDTRYISKEIKKYLAPVVRMENEREATPVGLLPMVGSITDRLKDDWGLKEVWKEMLIPRFKRMNEITQSNDYYNEVADQYGRKSFIFSGHNESIKRLDHRHHALDALVIASITRDHIHYLNALEAENKNYSLINKLKGHNKHDHPNKNFLKPWTSFNQDIKRALEKMVVSFKNTNRVLARGTNQTEFWCSENGKTIKKKQKQQSEDLWAIRQPLHKETVFGSITLRRYKQVSLNNAIEDYQKIADPTLRNILKALMKQYNNDAGKVKKHLKDNPLKLDGKEINSVTVFYFEEFSTTRKALDTTFNYKMIEKVSNQRIQNILKSHLDKFGGDPEKAFTPEGIEEMNSRLHLPILKVRWYESMGKKFPLGESGINAKKFVEAAKGTNLFFVVYENIETKERYFNDESSLALKNAVELMKNKLPLAEEKPGYRWFLLSPGDLVYVPECDDEGKVIENVEDIDWNNISPEVNSKIYKVVSFTGSQAFFIPNSVAIVIENKKEYGSVNKIETIGKVTIKKSCIKLLIDRLGKVKPAVYDCDRINKPMYPELPSHANEPPLTYGGANIQFFNSLHEENEATFKYMAERTPEENLKAANMIISAMYRKELENKEKPYTNITFLNDGLPD